MSDLNKKDTLIHAVMNRWPTKPYRVLEKAADEALAALENGKSLRECIDVAKEYVESN